MLDLHGYGGMIFRGAITTVELALCSLALSITLGLISAMAKQSEIRILRRLSGTYTTVMRGVPDLVLMLLVYYGGQTLVNYILTLLSIDTYVAVNPFIAGVFTIGVVFGAYMSETFRGALQAIPDSQLDAAYSLGLNRFQVDFHIRLPQLIRYAIPGFGNNWLILLKATAIVSIIGLDDMVRQASAAAGATRQPFTFYITVAIYYLALTTISTFFLERLERRYQWQ